MRHNAKSCENKTKPVKWEPPELVDLNTIQKAEGGHCEDGSGVANWGIECTNGAIALGCLSGSSIY